MTSFPLIWIPLLPLLGAAFNLMFGSSLNRKIVHLVACGSVLCSCVLSAMAVFGHLVPAYLADPEQAPRLTQTVFEWIAAGSLHIDFGLLCDSLTGVMILVITFIGFLIHLYSTEYMSHDESYARFFGYLNLFTGAMLLLVMGDNLAVLFVGWEGVGVCSYLLIGFWYNKNGTQEFGTENASAGRKAFIVNRIGDFAFLLAMFLIFATVGSLDFSHIASNADKFSAIYRPMGLGMFSLASIVALLMFVGATGKSAQIPLYVWLPDAMAGPTPVSALIHAATMVTAGVYMIARMNFLFMMAPAVMGLVALVGAITAFFAATIGFAQNDIKKVLAYSTVSQLGYMFIGVGVGAFSAGIFHVFTHAFFKACLFLGAGAVIHALHEQQDIRKMGGLRSVLGTTHWTFAVSSAALAGIFPLSGFFSKDEILWKALSTTNPQWPIWFPSLLYVLGMGGAFCTAFYMGRLYSMTFLGSSRLSVEEQQHIHRPGLAMRLPLIVLAVGAATLGVLGLPGAFGEHLNVFHAWLEPVVGKGLGAATEAVQAGPLAHNHHVELILMFVSFGVAVLSSFVAYRIYRTGPSTMMQRLVDRFPRFYRLIFNKYYIDEIYQMVIIKPFKGLCWLLYRLGDTVFLDGIVIHGVSRFIYGCGHIARRLQNGQIQHYVAILVIGVALILYSISAPKAGFVVQPGSEISAGQPAIFDASHTGNTISRRHLQYRWDVNGDGKWDYPKHGHWSDSPTVTHTFDRPGKYKAVLRVRDPRWNSWRQRARVIEVHPGTTKSQHHSSSTPNRSQGVPLHSEKTYAAHKKGIDR